MNDVKKYIESLSHVFGCHVSFHDQGAGIFGLYPSLPNYHANLFCDHIKKTKSQNKLCCGIDVVRLRQKMSFERAIVTKTCHAGVSEIVFPIFKNGRLGAIMFVGPFTGIRLQGAPDCSHLSQDRKTHLSETEKQLKNSLPSLSEESTRALVSLGELIAGTIGKSISSQPLEPDAPQKERIQDFLERNFCRSDLYLGELARHMGIGQTSLCQLLKRCYGKTFSELLTERRMEHARRMLKETFLKTELIGSLCGYNDASYFYRTFKTNNKGLTSSAYRRKFTRHIARIKV